MFLLRVLSILARFNHFRMASNQLNTAPRAEPDPNSSARDPVQYDRKETVIVLDTAGIPCRGVIRQVKAGKGVIINSVSDLQIPKQAVRAVTAF